MTLWYQKSVQAVLEELKTDRTQGLSQPDVAKRLRRYGTNSLPEVPVDSFLTIFLRQFQSPLIYILAIASVAIYFLNEPTDSYTIITVLIFNAIIGTFQEGRAQNTLKALRRLATTTAIVIREGKRVKLLDTSLVPGDIIELREGEKIPADARLLDVTNLSVNESALSGEVIPVHKTIELEGFSFNDQSRPLPLGDQKNMVFRGTYITGGHGLAVIVATGKESQLGAISQAVETIHTEIPLQAKVRQLVRTILTIVIIASLGIFCLGLLRGYSLVQMFATVVSLAVSVIPEGLPVVMTVVLSTGIWRMSRRNALVKKLQAVEALGQTEVIAIDKTGTITLNQLMVSQIFVHNTIITVDGTGYEPVGRFTREDQPINVKDFPDLIEAGKIATLCSNAVVAKQAKTGEWHVNGDPTEAALRVLGQKLGFDRRSLEKEIVITEELPFDYTTKIHVVVGKDSSGLRIMVVGSPEAIIERCETGKEAGQKILSMVEKMASHGLRVVAFATKRGKAFEPDKLSSLEFGGLFGITDVLHPEVVSVITELRHSGIKPVMITGDHQSTATAIAQSAGIFREGDVVLTGQDLQSYSKSKLRQVLKTVSVFARVSPSDKQTIIETYRGSGITIAMTGDGVNDAPSLVAADLGVAMGKQGTEVAKEAADIVLLDDNLKSVVAAVEEGRSIYKTIQKVILYLFSTSLGEAFVIIVALALGIPLIITASQIIWLNFVTDGFLTVALAMEPRETGLLKNRWRPTQLVTPKMFGRMAGMGLTMMLATLLVYPTDPTTADSRYVSSMVLTLLAVAQWYNALNCRHDTESIFSRRIGFNPWLVVMLAVVFGLQLAALHLSGLQSILHTQPLTLTDWLVILLTGSLVLWTEEMIKIFRRYRLVVSSEKR